MRKLSIFAVILLLPLLVAMAQESPQPAENQQQQTAPAATTGRITIPAGTQIPLVLKQAISTKSAKVGDAVYAETAFPITQDDKVVIPAGTYVQGRISDVKRAGRVKGRAELLMHFTTLVYPNGYTALLPGGVENLPGAEKQSVKGDEGKIKQEGQKMEDAVNVGKAAGAGATVGAIASRTGKGAGIGGLTGAAAGLGYALLTRGADVNLPVGTSVQMVLQRPLTLEEKKLSRR
ncbi:MAG TPA: TrbI/VirB10 family protein [Terriglobales bacterium]|nr:TrbI/VirB10 family protein [Terriglobales bacterium]